MNAGKAVYGILSANSGVTDIVGTNIFPEIAEQETAVPFIVYQLQSVDPDDTHDGPSKLDEVRFEFLCYADSYNAAADLGVAVRAALDRVSGTYNGVHVESIQFNDVDVNIEYDPRRYSQVLTFTFRIKRDDVTIALGTPVTGAVLGDLSDVDVTGVTNGQLIAYNSTSGNWEAADDAGGAEVLNDLTDVDAAQPTIGQLLSYGQGDWTTIDQDEITLPIGSVTGLQAALDATPDNLRQLTDVTISGLADNDYLQYDWASGKWQNSPLILGRNGEQYTGNYDSEAETLLDGATETVELYYTAQADGDGLHEDAQTDTATTGYDIRRKLYYAEKAQADPNTSGDWTQFTAIADNTTFANAKAALLAYLKERTGGTVPISLKQTWEEVAQAPAFTGLLNESYGSGAAAAYSVRRLNGLYTGSAIQVERSSDNTTQDIGFDSNGDLDESALTTFCTGTTCKVRSWYDQSQTGGTGSGNDAVQTTHANQPTIYTGGAIVKENGRVALEFDGSDDKFTLGFSIANSDDLSYFYTGNYIGSGPANQWMIQTRESPKFFVPVAEEDDTNTDIIFGVSSASYYASGTSVTLANRGDVYAAFAGKQTLSTIFGTSGVSLSSSYLGGRIGNSYMMNGLFEEFIFYTSDKSTDRTSIESNIGDYFTQNTPLLDTYTGAAAAYSLRKLRSAYSGSAIRVRRTSDNTEQDIGFNVFGELDTVSLASFCSGTDGFVKVFYDQSGNANDATQTATGSQPKIYDSTTGVVTENGKPAVEFDGVNDRMTSAATVASDFTTSVVLKALTASQSNQWLLQDTSGTDMLLRQVATNFSWYDGSVYNIGTAGTDQHHIFVTANASGSVVSFDGVDQSISGIGNNGYTDLEIGGDSGSRFWHGRYNEIVIWGSYQASNRTGIETNLNTFYNIYA